MWNGRAFLNFLCCIIKLHDIVIVHARVLPCPAMGVLRTPGEETRGERGIITEKKYEKLNFQKINILGTFFKNVLCTVSAI